jgi:hypothetical protein
MLACASIVSKPDHEAKIRPLVGDGLDETHSGQPIGN